MDITFYQFSRAKIEVGDFSHFLSLYSPERLGSGRSLKQLMGSLELVVEGYDDDPRELYEIPEVRWFFSSLHRAWPHALYFSFLGAPEMPGAGLRTLALSCVPVSILRNDRTGLSGVSFGPELVQWVSASFLPMNRLFVRAGLSNKANIARSSEILEYFDLV